MEEATAQGREVHILDCEPRRILLCCIQHNHELNMLTFCGKVMPLDESQVISPKVKTTVHKEYICS
jgi:hypothetical protein